MRSFQVGVAGCLAVVAGGVACRGTPPAAPPANSAGPSARAACDVVWRAAELVAADLCPLGQDPIDERHPDFFDPDATPTAQIFGQHGVLLTLALRGEERAQRRRWFAA